MNAPIRIAEADPLTPDSLLEKREFLGNIEDFLECCADQAWFLDLGIIELAVAADNLQFLADRWGLIDLQGQDAIQAEMASALTVVHEDIPLVPLPAPPPRIYRTPQSTVDAFFFVLRKGDADYLSRWLVGHPLDAPHLLKIWERKNAVA
jgi:hypothetical protein